MADLSGLIDLIAVGDIAKQLGIPEEVAESAVKTAIPAIISGMAANAKDSAGAKSLEGALSNHGKKVPKGKAKVASIDTADGEKIINNVFGSKKNEVVAAVADASAGDVTKDIIAKVLPIIAPIVIAWIGSQFLGQKEAPAAEKKTETSSDGGIGDLLGGLLGSSQGQDIIGSVLGGLLGGGKK